MVRGPAKLAFVLLLLPFLALAAPKCDYAKVFKTSFQKDYVQSECQSNVCRLLGRLEKEGADLSKAKVVYLSGYLAPQDTRQFIVEWPYHTIVIYQGKVLDMDYTKEPTILTVDEYFKKNWLPNGYDDSKRAQVMAGKQVQLVEVAAKEYLDKFPLENPTDAEMQKFIDEVVSKNPIVPLNEFIDRIRAKP